MILGEAQAAYDHEPMKPGDPSMTESVVLTIRTGPAAEAHHWADALATMYLVWAFLHDGTAVMETVSGVPAGERAHAITVSGTDVSPLRDEGGTHCRVRVPPGSTLRHTVFAQVTVNGKATERPRRRYTLNPYQLVEDQLTGHETEAVEAVLAGHLELLEPGG